MMRSKRLLAYPADDDKRSGEKESLGERLQSDRHTDGEQVLYLAAGDKMEKKDNQLVYTADLNQSAFTSKDNQRIAADIDFTVITGTGFKDYANYRFVLEVDLLKTVRKESDNSETLVSITNNSAAHDWIVYTNAKINPDMLTLSEYAG